VVYLFTQYRTDGMKERREQGERRRKEERESET